VEKSNLKTKGIRLSFTLILLIVINGLSIGQESWDVGGNIFLNGSGNYKLGTTTYDGIDFITDNISRATIDEYGDISLGQNFLNQTSLLFISQATQKVGINTYHPKLDFEVVGKSS